MITANKALLADSGELLLEDARANRVTLQYSAAAGGAVPMVTVPIIEYVAKLGANRSKLASFDSRVYGAQDDCDWQWFPQACNGMIGGQAVFGNNPLDANVLNSTTLQAAWVSHFVQRFGRAADVSSFRPTRG